MQKQREKISKQKKIIFFTLVFFLTFNFFIINTAHAFDIFSFFGSGATASDVTDMEAGIAMQKNNIAVLEKEIAAAQATQDKIAIKDISSMRLELEIAKRNLAQAEKALADMNKNWIKDWAIEEAWQQLKQSGDIAWQQTLKFFLNTLAYDTATYLATGDKGQMPMFETEGWAGYLQNTADNAAGTFLETLGSSGPIKFNLCNPDPRVMMKINLGLMRTFRPKAPPCTFSTLVNNWEEALNDKDFLNKFQDMFNPWSNDLGIALTLQTGIESQVSREINNAAQDRIEGQGWRPVRSAIEGRIQTPADIVGAAARQPVSDSTASEKIHTGTILADSIDIFINTLAGKLMGQWLKKGLITDFPRLTNRLDSLSDPYGQRYNEGISGAENRFAGLTEPNFKVRGDYDILAELTTCPDPNKAGPTNCVIDEKFRQAIEKKLTVGQALKQGYLNGNGIFGFTSDGLEPRYNEGYPYRSMLILRKFRIIPLGWEIAAQKIKDQQSEVRGTKNLRDLVDCFADASQTWCYGLVDPDWVLEAPQNFCAAEGAGPEIMSEQITGQGADSQLAILRNDSYCADEQSCVKEKADGSCQQYGYCAEERRTWDFNANSCEPRDNTCQTFSSPAGEQVSYLKNTLDYGVCGAGNAGCAKYATGGTYADGAVNWSASPSIYLNQSAQTCEAADDGCSALIRQSGQTIYEKLLPDYLVNKVNGNRAAYDEGDCYDSQGRLLLGAPAKCSNFARMCAPAEAGCELYTGVNDGMKIPAQTDADDACPAECVGYNQFVQAETYFDLSRAAYFIPQTAKTCSAEAAGCEQFTNLDEQARGGEGIEYYSYLRQCVKPDKPDQPCGAFYSWEGSDESGYQLKNYQLKQNPDDKELPYTVDGPAQCAYGLAPGDDGYEANKDCREFYSRNGRVSYYIFDKTVSCTDDCHPYRQTVSAGPETCSGGGVWSEENKACLYMAVPDQGRTCSAAASGCREYAGNTGNDVRIIFTDNFDATGTVGEWSGAVAAASESLTLGSGNLGRSIKISGDAQRPVGTSVSQGKSYVLRFLAKTESGEASLNLALANDTASAAFSQSVGVNKNWQVKEANLAELDHEVTANEVLYLSFASGAGQKVYLDDITLTEITDRYYLIKDTWRDNCDYLDADPTKDTVSETFYSGCSAYTDRANKNYYLTQFDKLCSESSVGCELMTDTHNSTDNTASYYLSGNKVASCDPLTEPACVEVLADSQIYAVYDPSKSCSAQAKGCSLLGKEYKYGSEDPIYGDVYLKNDPDKYNTALCGAEAVGCKTYAYDGGETYFKDPGDQICEWRQEQDAGSGASSYGWYKKKVKRCGGAGAVCLADKDCSGVTCIPETTSDENLKCDTTDNKTLGLGGVGGKVSQPSNWAGTCSAAASGCTEYLDPLSQFNTNLIFNGSFADLDNLSSTANDGWESGTTACPSGICQNVTLKPNTVYRLARLKRDNVLPGTLSISCSAGTALYGITENNELTGPDNATSTPVKNYETSKTFYYRGSADASCTITAGSSAGAVELKKAVIDYQLAQNLDKQSCNGVVDFNKGCVLFNQRSQNGDYLAPLKWDADTGDIGGNIANAEKDSNLILKVAPDRVCGQWLACRSYIKDENGKNVCFDVGLCDAVDENGNCSSFINSPEENQIVGAADGQLSADNISNLSGYAKAGLPGGSLGGDYYPFGAMTQIGETANLSNGGFEFYGSNLYPVGWSWSGADKSWNTNVFSVINNPIRAQAEGIGYAPEGRVFLKLGSSYIAESEGIDVMPNTPYIITAYVNTKNLKSGQAKIDIKNSAGADIKQAVIWQDIGNDWQFKLGEFSSGGNSRIKIQLSASAVGARPVSEGNFYFDDIKIRPALESKCLESDGDCKTTPYNAWNTTQSCRLYPQSDSLACDYYEDSGKRQKGWYGYCLEYDRPPGDPNACLLWYPIDKVKGDGIEEGAGYQGKAPVYYCTEAKSLIPVEYRQSRVAYSMSSNWFNNWCNATNANLQPGYDVTVCNRDYCTAYPQGNCLGECTVETCNSSTIITNGWYASDGILQKLTSIGGGGDPPYDEAEKGIKFYDPSTGQIFDDTFAYCSKVVQTVTSVGDNKYWSSRVYNGSDWKVLPFNYQYTTDGAPFGSIVAPSSNPYDWDGSTADGNQPLLVKRPSSGGARASSPYMIATPAISGGICRTSKNFCATPGVQSTCGSGDICDAGSYYGTCEKTGNLCLHIEGITDTASSTIYELNKADCAPGEGKCQSVDFSGNAINKLKMLFAQSYGAWKWDVSDSRYVVDDASGVNWGLPGKCSNNIRNNPTDFCAVTPSISKIKINGSSADTTLTKNGFVNLTFNTKVDSNQLPLTMYAVDWGDGEKTVVSGAQMRDRPDPPPDNDSNYGNPHSLYHLYSYWDLKAKANQGKLTNGSYCDTAGTCYVKPRVQIKDNWGWYSKGTTINTAPDDWDSFGGYVVVKEK